jgi:hypothetical protein
MSRLALELSVGLEPAGLEPAVLHGGEDGAPRLARVPAVAETAVAGERLDVLEGRRDTLAGPAHVDRPESGRVDEEPAAREPEQLAVRRRVATTGVAGANVADRLAGLAEEGVEEGRLADARRAEQDRRPTRQEMGADLVESGAGRGADRDDRHARRDRPDLVRPLKRIREEVPLRNRRSPSMTLVAISRIDDSTTLRVDA